MIHNEDALYEDGGDYPYCRECFEKLNNFAIKNYSYKPEPIFYGSGPLYLGVELEIDKGGEEDSNAQKLLDIANENDERIYCKHDGSINDGFEIVSHSLLDQSLLGRCSVKCCEDVGISVVVELELYSCAVFGRPSVLGRVFFLGFYCFSPRFLLE